jgi:hypothetical protein
MWSSVRLRGSPERARQDEWEAKTEPARSRGRRRSFVGDVGDVHHHADAVHLPHHHPAEVVQAVVHAVRLRVEAGSEEVARGVGPVVGVGVGERHVADAETVEVPQRSQRVLDGVPALDAHEDRDLTVALGAADVGHGGGGDEIGGMGGHHALDEVDAIQGYPPPRAGVGGGETSAKKGR